MNAISLAVEAAGGPVAAAKACGLNRQAIDKWLAKGTLPRTEYTGETSHAERLAELAEKNGKPFDVAWLRASASPGPRAAVATPATFTDRRRPLTSLDKPRLGQRATDLTEEQAEDLHRADHLAEHLHDLRVAPQKQGGR